MHVDDEMFFVLRYLGFELVVVYTWKLDIYTCCRLLFDIYTYLTIGDE